MAEQKKNTTAPETELQVEELTDIDAARRAFIASEIFNRKY